MIDRVVGILTITNVHFQELFDQFLRHLQQATLSRIQIDTRVATISMHTVQLLASCKHPKSTLTDDVSRAKV